MNPSLKEQLKDWKKIHPESAPKNTENKTPHQKPKKARSERLSESDIKSLMNTDMRILRRGKGGVWR